MLYAQWFINFSLSDPPVIVVIILMFHASRNKSNNDKKVLNLQSYTKGNCYLLFTRTINFCFKQIIPNSTFKSALCLHLKIAIKWCLKVAR